MVMAGRGFINVVFHFCTFPARPTAGAESRVGVAADVLGRWPESIPVKVTALPISDVTMTTAVSPFPLVTARE